MRKIIKPIGLAFTIVILSTLFLAARSAHWFLTDWGQIDFATVVYQLYSPLKGASPDILNTYIRKCVSPAIIFAVFLLVLAIFSNANANYLFKLSAWSKTFTVRIDRKHSIAVRKYAFTICLIILLIYDGFMAYKTGMAEYVADILDRSNFIEEHYVDTETAEILFPTEKRNLILIYLESMENTYASTEEGGGFDHNCIPKLCELREDNITFVNKDMGLDANDRYGYTMGALFGSTTGLPYKLPVDDNNSAGKYELFFPGVVSMGEILEEEGYKNYFMCGSDAEFGGRKDYYEQHGNYTILDYNVAIDKQIIPDGYHTNWGFEDKILYEWAKDTLSEIATNDAPFNFTMLTVDTHHPDGYICDLCGDKYDRQYDNVISCADEQAYEFVTWIQAQDWYENTTVVVMGDHCSMNADVSDWVGDDYPRRIYNCYINVPEDVAKAGTKYVEHSWTIADMCPTILAAIGAHIDGDKIALGTNLFSDTDTLTDIYGYDYSNSEIHKYSKFYIDQFIKQ